MFDSDDFFNGTRNITISYELLTLLRWLVDHDAEKLKKLITKGFRHGLESELDAVDRGQTPSTDDIHTSVVDFLTLLEAILLETVNERIEHNLHKQELIPELDKIDVSLCDSNTLHSILQKTTAKLERHPEKSAKDTLHRELLKLWLPRPGKDQWH